MTESPPNFLLLSKRQERELKALAAGETDQLFVSAAQLAQVCHACQLAGVTILISPPQVRRVGNSFSWAGEFSVEKV
jgi:hypothetical protein